MDIQQPLASMMLDKVLDVPEWSERARCYTHNTDDEGFVRLDPFDEDDYDQFRDELCGKCPVIKECRDAITNVDTNIREINFGMFHGDEYPPDRSEEG